MRNIFLLLLLSASTYFSNGQERPKIGSEKGVKEKLWKIKKSLPDFKKNLVVKDRLYTEEDKYDVKMEMGDGIILFEEDEDKQQTLIIRFSGPYFFSGSIADFKQYYVQLGEMLKEIFKNTLTADEVKTEKKWEMTFWEIGKKSYESAVTIKLKTDWFMNKPEIQLVFFTHPSGKVPKL
ncbi:MAG: hypothetical protein IPL50_12265 [Chitinophagaceae bacterium]|nr:hypothetical protein [Chitinophagaceae bacterium]